MGACATSCAALTVIRSMRAAYALRGASAMLCAPLILRLFAALGDVGTRALAVGTNEARGSVSYKILPACEAQSLSDEICVFGL